MPEYSWSFSNNIVVAFLIWGITQGTPLYPLESKKGLGLQ